MMIWCRQLYLKFTGLIVLYLTHIQTFIVALEPDFTGPLMNISVAVGRDATFICGVKFLGGYRVGWIKANTKAIQAIHDQVITHNPRVSVSHTADTWNLHIKSVKLDDSGGYVCQVNTDPMKSIIGYLTVLEPPDFNLEESSTDIVVSESDEVSLVCKASGRPKPHITWKREDGADIVIKDSNGGKFAVPTYQGEVLHLSRVSREAMGTYLCIASNGIPPSISKKTYLNVLFHPTIHVPNQLVGAPLGTDVSLECIIQASPKPIVYWIKDTGEMVVTSSKYDLRDYIRSSYETRAVMTIYNLNRADVGTYRCISKNSIGEVDSSIRLYEIPGYSVYQPTQPSREEPDETRDEQLLTNNVVNPAKPTVTFIVENSVENNVLVTGFETRKTFIIPRINCGTSLVCYSKIDFREITKYALLTLIVLKVCNSKFQ